MLYYFGWIRASSRYGYFGVDVSNTLGLSAADYVRESSTVVFTPLTILLLAALVIAFAANAADVYLTNPGNSHRLRYLANGVHGTAALALVCAVVLLARPDLVAPAPLTKPIMLAVGALLALYAMHVRALILRSQAHREAKSDDLAGALYRGIFGGVVVLALFWATAILAREQGLQAARLLERNLPSVTGVVVYTHDNEDITGRGVRLVLLDPSGAAFRFRYTGLRLLRRAADGAYVLLPRGWTHTNGSPAYVLGPTAGIRVDVQALPAD
jgi:hypothetical protein